MVGQSPENQISMRNLDVFILILMCYIVLNEHEYKE